MKVASLVTFSVYVALLCVAFFGSCPTVVTGQVVCPDSPVSTLRKVYVQLIFNDISKVDGIEQAFYADFYMASYWELPEATCPGAWDTSMWTPGLEFINKRESECISDGSSLSIETFPSFINTSYPNHGYNMSNLWGKDDNRCSGVFKTSLNMEEFPYDTQHLTLFIESFYDDSEVEVLFSEPLNPKVVWPIYGSVKEKDIREDFVTGWYVLVSETRTLNTHHYYPGLNRQYHRLHIDVQLERRPDFYVNKIVAGCVMLVFMCIWVFSLQIDEADRMMGTLQVFAGLITFLFVASADTPKVPYSTRLDYFMLACFALTMFILFIHGLLYYWRECAMEEGSENAHKAREDSKHGRSRRSSKVHAEEPVIHPDGSAAIELGSMEKGGDAGNKDADKGVKRVSSVHSRLGDLSGKGCFGFLKAWFRSLVFTRQVDAIAIPALSIIFILMVAIILGRPVTIKHPTFE